MQKRKTEPKAFKEDGALTLQKPMYIDGTQYNALPYDFGGLTVEEHIEVLAERQKIGNTQGIDPIGDLIYLTMLFWKAVEAKIPTANFADMRRMGIKDQAKAAALALGFRLGDAGTGAEETSETELLPLQ